MKNKKIAKLLLTSGVLVLSHQAMGQALNKKNKDTNLKIVYQSVVSPSLDSTDPSWFDSGCVSNSGCTSHR